MLHAECSSISMCQDVREWTIRVCGFIFKHCTEVNGLNTFRLLTFNMKIIKFIYLKARNHQKQSSVVSFA